MLAGYLQKTGKGLKETGHSRYIYINELDKDCLQHDMAYGDFRDLARRTAADKVLRVFKHLILLKIQNMMDMKEDWLLWFINFMIKKLLVVVLNLCSKMSD